MRRILLAVLIGSALLWVPPPALSAIPGLSTGSVVATRILQVWKSRPYGAHVPVAGKILANGKKLHRHLISARTAIYTGHGVTAKMTGKKGFAPVVVHYVSQRGAISLRILVWPEG